MMPQYNLYAHGTMTKSLLVYLVCFPYEYNCVQRRDRTTKTI